MGFRGTLRPYQVEDVQRCVKRGRMLIAYEPGLGKTPMSIAVIEGLNQEFPQDPLSGLVFAGASLRYQWAQALAQFTDLPTREVKVGRERITVPTEEHCLIIDGGQDQRLALYQRARDTHPRYILLGYEHAVNDWNHVCRLPMDYLLGDEISALKTPAAARSQAMKELDAEFVFGLSGDPIENGKPTEIFSIMEWVDPSIFGRADLFDRTFVVRHPTRGYPIKFKNLAQFHDRLSTGMVRKRAADSDVAPYLPESRPERTTLVRFDPAGAELYWAIADDLSLDLAQAIESHRGFDVMALYSGDPEANAMQGRIAAKISCLRMLCDHPHLLATSASDYVVAKAAGKAARGSAYAAELMERQLIPETIGTPKVDAVLARLDAILGANDANKVIVFCTFKGVLAALAERTEWRSVVFNGEMSPRMKEQAKVAFLTDQDCRLFLSSDAGGYGVDLPVANYLINVGLPFSAGKANQRNSRHRRASSTWSEIHVENVLMDESIEVFYSQRLRHKIAISKAMVDGEGANAKGGLTITAQSLSTWLAEHRPAPGSLRRISPIR